MITLTNGKTVVEVSEGTRPTWEAMGYKPVEKVPAKVATRTRTRKTAAKTKE